jgi:hypothetical protein
MTVSSQGVAVDALTSLEESGIEITKSLGRCQSINRYPYQTVNPVANPMANPMADPLQGDFAEPAARPGRFACVRGAVPTDRSADRSPPARSNPAVTIY